MELYILDSAFKRTNVIDRFESLIWTERFQDYGDFELLIHSNRENRNLLKYGTRVAVNKSNRIMTIEEVENKTDDEGRKILSIKGSSMEKTLQDRIASNALSNLTSISKGTAAINIANGSFTINNHGLITGDQIYFETTGVLCKKLNGTGTYANITDNTFKVVGHNLQTGDAVYLTTTGTLPTGITSGTTYYIIVVNNDLFKLATTATNAYNETAIDITGSRTGTHSLFSNYSAEPIYYAIVINDNTIKIADTYENAMANTNLPFYGTTSGIHTLYWMNLGKWRQVGPPADIAKNIFTRFLDTDPLMPTDVLPINYTESIYPPDSIPTPTTSVTIDFNIGTIYDIIKQICGVWGIGFRLVRKDSTGELYFNIYSGNDRTTSQTTRPAVVFDPRIDTLMGDTEYTSVKNLKNVAYVFSKHGYKTVYSTSADDTTSGFDKKILYVDASDITTLPGSVLDNQLTIRGQDALSTYRTLTAFDGEIPQSNSYVYEVDYILGDLVEVRNADGYSSSKRVTEQIFADDMQGERSYPTLSSELVVTPGSWLAWDSAQTWADVPNDLDHEWQDVGTPTW